MKNSILEDIDTYLDHVVDQMSEGVTAIASKDVVGMLRTLKEVIRREAI